MSRYKCVFFAMLTISVLLLGSSIGFAQDQLKVTGSLPNTPLPPPTLTGPIEMQSVPVGPQEPPQASVPPSASNQFEHHDDLLNLPRIFAHQWSLTNEIAPENVISERYLRSETPNARGLTLKEAIYIAMQNNPSLKAAELDPVASMETVREANGTFDPNLTAQGDIEKTVVPVTSALQTSGSAYVQKFYDWNFGLNKVSSVTNGTWGVTFNNDRALSNSTFAGVNPSYTPNLALSLSQPLLQNFGWKFATINVQIAESGQKQAQWTYGQALQDFVQKIGGDYWNVVLAEENLEVARAALTLQSRPGPPERDQRQGRHACSDQSAGSAIGGRHCRGQRVHRRSQPEKFPHPAPPGRDAQSVRHLPPRGNPAAHAAQSPGADRRR